MDNGDIDFLNPEVFGDQNGSDDLPSSYSIDSFFNNIFEDTQRHACTHTHTCNPPGPDLSHTHTCFHVHTKILSAPTDETAESAEKSCMTKKRPCGNREAVRKYREKKKARAASLEDEVVQLRAINHQLMKRLQGQAALEAEVARLRCLLVDLRGRIEGEIGSFPYQRPTKGSGDLVSNMTQANMLGGLNSCSFRCDEQVNCHSAGFQRKNVDESGSFIGQGFGVCEMGNMQCLESSTTGSKGFFGCGSGTMMPIDCSSNAKKLEGTELSGHKQISRSDIQNNS